MVRAVFWRNCAYDTEPPFEAAFSLPGEHQMAVIVTEFQGLRDKAQVPPVPPREQQSLTIGGAASAAFGRGTVIVEIDTDTACRVEFGADPAGTGDTIYIPALLPRQFHVQAGHKVIAVAV